MISVRTHALTKSLILLAAVASLLLVTHSTSAQQYRGSRNPRIGTIGDISQSKLRARVARSYGLRLGPAGLFGGAETFDFSQPRQFVFPLPNFAGAGLDFSDMTFNEYLLLVANSYEVADFNDYLFRFTFLNEITALTPDFFPTQSQVRQVHENDFTAGGGFLPLPGNPTIPNPTFIPLPNDPIIPSLDDPIFSPLPNPTIPTAGDSDTVDIASSSRLSASVANVSVVPEPATLGLMTLGIAMILKRSRRR